MSIVMHFATFLKLLTLNTGDKLRDLERYSKPGGFDFYRSSREGVAQHLTHGRSRDEVIKDIEATASASSRDRNRDIFERVADWITSQSGKPEVPNKGVWRSPNKIFSIHIEPEIALSNKSGQQVIAVYPRRDTRINRDQAGAGLLLLGRGYRRSGDESFGILDAFGNKVHRTPTNVSERVLDNEISFIESELKRILAG